MRVILLVVAACVTAVAQESRPLGLLPPESPLAPAQEALLRGESAEARATIDALLGTVGNLAGLAPQAALLRAASEPVETRADAMLAVAITYADSPIAESAAVAGIAALLYDGPEVGDLAEPLLVRSDAGARSDAARLARPSGPARDRLLGCFLEVLERRLLAPDRDAAALEHARRLVAQFPSRVNDWVRVRPCEKLAFPARLDQDVRLRFWGLGGLPLPDPMRMILPSGAPKIDVTLPANRDDVELPALAPGTWLVVATGASSGDRRAWPVMVSDLDVIVHSVHGRWKALATIGGKLLPTDGPSLLMPFFDTRLASRTRVPDQKNPDNAVLAQSGAHLAIAPISPAQTGAPPLPEQRLVADLWARQPVVQPGAEVQLRLCVRPLPAHRDVAGAPLRIVFWPRQPHEVVIEKTQAAVIPLEVRVPPGTPPGPVRAQVFDAGEKTAAGMTPEPILDVVAFSVQTGGRGPVGLLMAAPASWRQGAPPPRVELLGLLDRGQPAGGMRAVVTVSAGSFTQEDALVLDSGGEGSVTLGLDTIGAAAFADASPVIVSARLEAGGAELAKETRRIVVEKMPRPEDGPVLGLSLLGALPVAGEPLPLAVTGPAGETVLLTLATHAVLTRHEATLGADGRAEVRLPTEASWSSVVVLASTRTLKAGRLEQHLEVALAPPDAPTISIETNKTEYDMGDRSPVVRLAVTSKTPLDQTTVSLAIVDDRLLRFAGIGVPNPDAALRPRAAPLALRASSSPAPIEAASWYASMLGRGGEWLSSFEPRLGMAPVLRGLPRGTLGGAANDLGSMMIRKGASLWPTAPTGAPIDVNLALNYPARWRIIAVAIDGEGRSCVAERTVSRTHSAMGSRFSGRPEEGFSRVTTARAFLDKANANGRFTATLVPEPLPNASTSEIRVRTFPYPGQVSEMIAGHLHEDLAGCTDHLAARIVELAARIPPKVASPESPNGPLADLAWAMTGLRDLKTRDGWSWRRDGPTDFETTPVVLEALAIAAEAGVDPAAFGAAPDPHDGFLRIAPRVLGEALGNPMAALDLEEVRNHTAFMQAVPPDRRPLVLVETVIGVLALDPAAPFAKQAIAEFIGRMVEVPAATIARAGLALLRAGETGGAQNALVRLEQMRSEEPGALALHLELSRKLGMAPDHHRDLIDRLARVFTRDPWPPPFASALAERELLVRFPSDARKKDREEETSDSPAGIEVSSDVPAIAIATRAAAVRETEARGNPVPAIRLFLGDQPLDPRHPSAPEGSTVRIVVSVAAPSRPFEVRVPVPAGMRVLRAPNATYPAWHVAWLFQGAGRDASVEVEALVEVEHLAAWGPVDIVSLDTLEVLGSSASVHFTLTPRPEAPPAPSAASTAIMLDAAALAAAREPMATAITNAPDRDAAEARLKKLLELPALGLSQTVQDLLPVIAPLLNSPDVLARVVNALGTRRAALWARENADSVTANGRRARAIADLVSDDGAAGNLVAAWRAGPTPLGEAEARLAGLVVVAKLRTADPADVEGLWDPAVLLKLFAAEDLHDAEARAERLAASVALPFLRNFARLFGGAQPVRADTCEGWVRICDLLEARLRGPAVTPDILALVAAVTERSSHEAAVFTPAEVGFRFRQAGLRALAAARGVEMLEAGVLPVEAAGMPLLTSVAAADHVPRILRALQAASLAAAGERAVATGEIVLARHRASFAIDDDAGALLASLAATGPRPWRAPAVLAINDKDRRRIPVAVVAQLLKDPEARATAIDLLLERSDSSDLLLGVIDRTLPRRDARAVLEHLADIDPRPFERLSLPRLLDLLGNIDADAAKPVEEEVRRRAEDDPGAITRALAASRNDRVRDVLVHVLANAHVTEVPWDPADPVAERLQMKLGALSGGPTAPACTEWIRDAMATAIHSSQSQGASDPVLQELWPFLAPNATPRDVLQFGTPSLPGLIEARAAKWGNDEIAAFLTSPAALSDPASSINVGSVSTVVRLIGPARLWAFSGALLALWRASAESGPAFEALSLFGQLGPTQVAALRQVMAGSRFSEEQQLAYVAALARDPAIHEKAEPILRASLAPAIAAALARYTLEVTGHWREPATASTRPSGPRTPEDWQRALITRLRNEGLPAVSRAEAPILEAWRKTLRERGLLVR